MRFLSMLKPRDPFMLLMLNGVHNELDYLSHIREVEEVDEQ